VTAAREILVLPSKQEVASQGAERFISAAGEAIGERGEFSVALAGGSTPIGMYELLAAEPLRGRVAWENVRFYWGDERCVPPDHPDSNYGAAAKALIEPLGIPLSSVHRMRGELDPAQAAEEYALEIQQRVPGRPPALDLVLLGMGDDGHTASLFPGTEALDATERLVTENYVPKLGSWRITLTARLINAARRVIFLVTGDGKADSLRAVLEGDDDPHQVPSKLISPRDGQLVWLLDEGAAGKLTSARS